MKATIDSLKYLHRQIDSLKHVKSSQSIFLKLNEVSVQTAIIAALTTLITFLLGLLIKDILMPWIVELRTKNREGKALFRHLKKELFFAANAFDRRVHEIFRTRSHYLWQSAPLMGFYDYKFRSTVFRMCSLLGWMRAYRLQQERLVIRLFYDDHQHILSKFQKIESALADGQLVEMYIVKAVLKLLGTDPVKIDQDKLAKFSVSLDHHIHEICQKYNVAYVSDANDMGKLEFISKLEQAAKDDGLTLTDMSSYRDAIVKEASIKQGLIYRDWQQAIGDLMLEKEGDVYQTISYKQFEAYWEQKYDTPEKKWLIRAEKMFLDLNLVLGPTLDARIEQLPRIYAAVYELQETLYKIDVGRKPIKQKDFNDIEKTIS